MRWPAFYSRPMLRKPARGRPKVVMRHKDSRLLEVLYRAAGLKILV